MPDPADVRDTFERLVAELDYPMFVVGAADGDDAAACLVGFTTQCSIEPPRFQVCLSKKNRTCEVACRADTLIVHRLGPDQQHVAEHFGGTSEKHDPTKLTDWSWTPGPGGAPVIEGCDWFAGRVHERLDLGDHVGFVLAPFDGACHRDGQLGFQAVRTIDPGQP